MHILAEIARTLLSKQGRFLERRNGWQLYGTDSAEIRIHTNQRLTLPRGRERGRESRERNELFHINL